MISSGSRTLIAWYAIVGSVGCCSRSRDSGVGRASGGRASDTIAAIANTIVVTPLLAEPAAVDTISVLVDDETKLRGIDVSMSPNEKCPKDGLSKDIEDTVEDRLAVWRDDISTLRKSPCNWIEEPEEDRPGTANAVSVANILGEVSRLNQTDVADVVSNEEEREHCEYEVPPFV